MQKRLLREPFFVLAFVFFDMAEVLCLSNFCAAISKVALLSQAQRNFAGLNSLAFASANGWVIYHFVVLSLAGIWCISGFCAAISKVAS